MIYLDTHVAVWLYQGEIDLISQAAQELIEADEILLSPAVQLELEYLYDCKRTLSDARKIVEVLERDFGAKVCDLPFPDVVSTALEAKWTRDPFDRLIVAQARINSSPLLTKDRVIRKHYSGAVW